MIGFFIFEETPTLEKPLCLAHSALNTEIKGLFYTKMLDSKDISGVQKNAEFFGVLDDSSGFGACLFVKDIQTENDALLLQNSLHVKKNTTIDGNLKVCGQITGKSNVTKLILSATDVSALAAQVALHPKPTPLGVTLESVTVEMKNG